MKCLALGLVVVLMIALNLGATLEVESNDEEFRQKPEEAERLISLKSYGDSNYVVVRDGGSWFEGEKLCEELGGSLAAVNSQGEWEHIYGELKRLKIKYCWLGGSKVSYSWRWKSGGKISVRESPWFTSNQIQKSGCILTENPSWKKQSESNNWRVMNCSAWQKAKFRSDFKPLCEILETRPTCSDSPTYAYYCGSIEAELCTEPTVRSLCKKSCDACDSCEDFLESCQIMEKRPESCEEDVDLRMACAKSCHAC